MKRQFWHNGQSASYLKIQTWLFIEKTLTSMVYWFYFFKRKKCFSIASLITVILNSGCALRIT